MPAYEWCGGMRKEGNRARGDEPRFQPVLAIGLDGVLRRLALRTGPEPGALLRTITLHRGEWPFLGRRQPAWNGDDTWTSVHEFSRVGVEWVRGLLSRGVTVTWATRWRGAGSAVFSQALGLGELPIAPAGLVPDVWGLEPIKARYLGRRFDGRPLAWVDAYPGDANDLVSRRLPADRRRTLVYRVPDPIRGLSENDVRRLDDWVELMSSPAGHEEMRRQRRREFLQRKRRPEGPNESWSFGPRTARIFRDLHRVIPDDPDVLHTLTDLAMTWALRPEEIEALLQVRGYADERTLREVTDVLKRHTTPDQRGPDAQ